MQPDEIPKALDTIAGILPFTTFPQSKSELLVELRAAIRQLASDKEKAEQDLLEAYKGITDVVWGFDPAELLTVGRYGADLKRVWNRAENRERKLRELLTDGLALVLLTKPEETWGYSHPDGATVRLTGIKEWISETRAALEESISPEEYPSGRDVCARSNRGDGQTVPEGLPEAPKEEENP